MSQTYKCPRCDYAVQLTAQEAAQVGTPICGACDIECGLINTARLYDLAVEIGIQDLDELVHDAKSGEAAGINNEGLGSQIDYLVEYYGEKDLEQKIREADHAG